MAESIRVYYIVDAAAVRTPEQWSLLVSGARDKPLSAGIIAAANASNFPHNHLNFNRPSVRDLDGKYRYRLGDFEVDRAQVDALLMLLNARATFYGITGSNQEKFRQVLLKEIQEVCVEAGYPALAPLLNLSVIGFGPREEAIEEATAWVLARLNDWLNGG